MPPRKQSAKRVNPSISGMFEQHLDFLRRDTGLEYTAIMRLAVADLAKRRGFVAPPPQTVPLYPKKKSGT